MVQLKPRRSAPSELLATRLHEQLLNSELISVDYEDGQLVLTYLELDGPFKGTLNHLTVAELTTEIRT